MKAHGCCIAISCRGYVVVESHTVAMQPVGKRRRSLVVCSGAIRRAVPCDRVTLPLALFCKRQCGRRYVGRRRCRCFEYTVGVLSTRAAQTPVQQSIDESLMNHSQKRVDSLSDVCVCYVGVAAYHANPVVVLQMIYEN